MLWWDAELGNIAAYDNYRYTDGKKDDVVLYSNALIFYKRLKSLGVTTEPASFENSGHGDESDTRKIRYTEELDLQLI